MEKVSMVFGSRSYSHKAVDLDQCKVYYKIFLGGCIFRGRRTRSRTKDFATMKTAFANPDRNFTRISGTSAIDLSSGGSCCASGRPLLSFRPSEGSLRHIKRLLQSNQIRFGGPLILVKFLSRFAKAVFLVAKSVVRLQSSKTSYVL